MAGWSPGPEGYSILSGLVQMSLEPGRAELVSRGPQSSWRKLGMDIVATPRSVISTPWSYFPSKEPSRLGMEVQLTPGGWRGPLTAAQSGPVWL